MQWMQNMPKEKDNKTRMCFVRACSADICVIYSITGVGSTVQSDIAYGWCKNINLLVPG